MSKRKRSKNGRRRNPAVGAAAADIERALDQALADHRAGRVSAAEAGYRRVLEQQPDHANALNLLGLMALDAGFIDDAIELAERAVRAAPDVGMFHANLGTALMEKRRRDHTERAEAALRTAIELGFEGYQAPFNLGLLLMERGRTDEALAALRRAVALDPASEEAGFLCAALSGAPRDTAPPSYVVSLFDSYAGQFEDHVTGALEYRVPQLLRAMVARELPGAGGLRVVDVGCGTGLCGAAFRDLAASMTGCDLAPRMIAAADQRQIYDHLEVADAAEHLVRDHPVESVDLIVAGDVFIYVGELERTARAMARALRAGGHVAFSVESAAGDGFELRPSGRFAHSPAYLGRVADSCHLAVAACEPATLRKEADRPIAGYLYLWRKR